MLVLLKTLVVHEIQTSRRGIGKVRHSVSLRPQFDASNIELSELKLDEASIAMLGLRADTFASGIVGCTVQCRFVLVRDQPESSSNQTDIMLDVFELIATSRHGYVPGSEKPPFIHELRTVKLATRPSVSSPEVVITPIPNFSFVLELDENEYEQILHLADPSPRFRLTFEFL